MKKITKTEEQCLRDHAIYEDRKLKKVRIILLFISVCCALMSTYVYLHRNEHWREWGAASAGGIFFLVLFWKVSLPYKLKRMINQGLSFQENQKKIFE